MQYENRWLSVIEIAAYLGVSKESIYRWIEQQKIPAHRIGKFWKFKIDEVDEQIRGGNLCESTPTKEVG